jgi:uncharacterized membrane protein
MTLPEPAAAPSLPPPSLQHLRAGVLAVTAALIALGLGWELWLAPTGRGTLAIKVLPLSLALGGVARHRLYTYRWLSLLVWLYVGEGALRAASDLGLSRSLAFVEAALALALFAACTAYIRLRLRRAGPPER